MSAQPQPPNQRAKPASRPTIDLDYALPDAQLDPAEQRERERREALETYNESTFGQRRPDSWLVRLLGMFAVSCLLVFLFPERISRGSIGELLATVTMVVYLAW